MGYILKLIARMVRSIRVVAWHTRARLLTAVLVGMTVVGVLSGPLRAVAQEAETVYRLGLLHSAASGVGLFTDAFREGMRERGYVEGKN